jgi:hypothetical protein
MCDIPVVVEGNNILAVVIATESRTSVRIVSLSLKAVVPDVIESPVGKTATAALITVAVRTVNNLLD